MVRSVVAQEFSADEFLSGLTTSQRCVVGFPAVGSAYWTMETINGVHQRYPSMDMIPYVEGLKNKPSATAASAVEVARL